MDFLSALTELKEGRCEGIKRKFATNTFYKSHESLDCIVYIEHMLSNDWQLVNPKPKYEEVEVVQYALVDENGIQQATSNESFLMRESGMFNFTEVKLTGTYQKEVKPKVVKRKQIGDENTLYTKIKESDDDIYNRIYKSKNSGMKIIVEWEEDAE